MILYPSGIFDGDVAASEANAASVTPPRPAVAPICASWVIEYDIIQRRAGLIGKQTREKEDIAVTAEHIIDGDIDPVDSAERKERTDRSGRTQHGQEPSARDHVRGELQRSGDNKKVQHRDNRHIVCGDPPEAGQFDEPYGDIDACRDIGTEISRQRSGEKGDKGSRHRVRKKDKCIRGNRSCQPRGKPCRCKQEWRCDPNEQARPKNQEASENLPPPFRSVPLCQAGEDRVHRGFQSERREDEQKLGKAHERSEDAVPFDPKSPGDEEGGTIHADIFDRLPQMVPEKASGKCDLQTHEIASVGGESVISWGKFVPRSNIRDGCRSLNLLRLHPLHFRGNHPIFGKKATNLERCRSGLRQRRIRRPASGGTSGGELAALPMPTAY